MNKSGILTRIYFLVLFGFLGVFVSGCQPDVVKGYVKETDVPAPTFTPPTIFQKEKSDHEVPFISQPTMTGPVENPLDFNLPTPQPHAVSHWRPALYETPWALGPFDHFYFTRPIAADEVNWPLPYYRYGAYWPGNENIVHTGIDIDATRGTPILAAGSGKVIWAGYGLFFGTKQENDPYGLAVSIEHDYGYKGKRLYTTYAHMDRIDAIVGQKVESGTPIGIVGNTGNSTGPHLHFEVRIEDNSFYATRNPELWLAPPQGWGLIVGRIMYTNGDLMQGKDLSIQSIDTGQKWRVITYGKTTVNSDGYYQENIVMSDLPVGDYLIQIDYEDEEYYLEIAVQPGAIRYFNFRGEKGFDTSLPKLKDPNNLIVPD